ncbi:hypothetical protein GCM10028825_19090 [Spirosoma agri]
MVLALFLTLLAFERWTVYNTPLSGLDGSWMIALHLAHQQELVHGTEFVFTYGPLSWLITRLPIAAPVWAIVAFDGLWLLNVYFVLWVAAGPRLTLTRALLLTGLVVVHRQCATTETPFMYYFFVLVYLLYHQQTGKRWVLAVAVSLATLTFYLKANVGLVSLGSVIVYGLWLVRSGPDRVVGLVVIGALLTLVGISAQLLPVALLPFLRAQWHMIDSYNDVMYQLQDWKPLAAALLILAFTVFLVGYASWQAWRKHEAGIWWRQNGIVLVLMALQLFVLVKEAFVRADAGHMGLFYKYALLPLSLLVLFGHIPLLRRLTLVPILLISAIGPFFVAYHWDTGLWYRWIPQWISYVQDIREPLHPGLTPVPSPWPAHWRTLLKNKRVDVVPGEIALLYQNQLDYTPRPVIQTYQVTDAYLDSLNAKHFLSTRAPDYVLVTGGSVDNRDPCADETLTKLSLRRAYRVVDTFGEWALLNRRSAPLALTLIRDDQTSVRLNEPIPVTDNDSTSIQLWQLEGHYGLAGYLSRLLMQPPRLALELTYQTGDLKRFRTALPLLRSGLLLPEHPRSQAELKHHWQTSEQQPAADQMRSFRLLSAPNLPLMFAPTMCVHRRVYRIELVDG